mgnify:CR=1 FL=1
MIFHVIISQNFHWRIDLTSDEVSIIAPQSLDMHMLLLAIALGHMQMSYDFLRSVTMYKTASATYCPSSTFDENLWYVKTGVQKYLVYIVDPLHLV